MTLIPDVFLELEAPKNLVRSMSKKLCITESFDKQHSKWVAKLLQYDRQHLYNIH